MVLNKIIIDIQIGTINIAYWVPIDMLIDPSGRRLCASEATANRGSAQQEAVP